MESSPPITIFDSHFHIWDIRPDVGYADPETLFSPDGTEHPGLYNIADLERQWQILPKEFQHQGGIFLEAISCCFKKKTGPELGPICVQEAAWVAADLLTSPTKVHYYLVPSASLEDQNVKSYLTELATNPNVRGIRQVLNVAPSWPRNGENGLGDLLENEQWKAGYAKLAEFGFSFDMQLNPNQFQKGAALAKAHPTIPVIINHLGTPTAADLTDNDGQVYWEGMMALASAGKHVSIKISMLCYVDVEWDQYPLVAAAVLRIIKLFGSERCFFASNYPVELLPDKGAWTPDKLYPAFLKLVKGTLSDVQVRGLFDENVRRVYRC